MNRVLTAAIVVLGLNVSTVRGEEAPLRHWTLSLEGSYALPKHTTFGVDHRQTALWGSAGYRFSRWWGLGWEGGHFFDRAHHRTWGVPPDDLRQDENRSSSYTGPFAELSLPWRWLALNVRAGAGVCLLAIDYQSDYLYHYADYTTRIARSYFEYRETDPALTFATSAEASVLPWLRLGLGIRDLMLVRHESTFDQVDLSYRAEDRIRVRHVWMPFVRMSVLF
jgi:hypothetical protein